jgi:fatty acid desaturase
MDGTGTEGISRHRAAVAAIPREEYLALQRLSDRQGARRLAGHLGLLALTGLAIAETGGALRLAAQVAHGVVLVFLFAACHEAIHRTAFATPRFNDRLAVAAGFLILLPPKAFRAFHFAHHRHTQDPARDPELATPKPRSLAEYALHLTGWRYWWGQGAAMLGAALGRPLPPWTPPRAARRIRAEARAFLAGYALVALASAVSGSAAAWEHWVLPALLGQPVLRAYLLAEHAGLPFGNDMLRNTRTTVTARALAWLAWEGNHHTAHHAAPTVPFFRLAAMTDRLRPHGIAEAAGYRAAHRRILATLGAGR